MAAECSEFNAMARRKRLVKFNLAPSPASTSNEVEQKMLVLLGYVVGE